MRNSLLYICASLMAIACSPVGEQQNAAVSSPSQVDYYNVRLCWTPKRPNEKFTGAVAAYRTERSWQNVMFSSRCKIGTNYEDIRKAFRARVRCISGITELAECRVEQSEPVLNEQTFDPGVRPEFPIAIYVIRGTFSGDIRRGSDSLVFDHLNVSNFQKIPKEMFGAFLMYPEDRQSYIEHYLNSGALNEDGYKTLE